MSAETNTQQSGTEFQGINPETLRVQFDAQLSAELVNMNNLYPNGYGYRGGPETYDSLTGLARTLGQRVDDGDKAMGDLIDVVEAQASTAQAERSKPFTGDSPRIKLLLALRPMLRPESQPKIAEGSRPTPETTPSPRRTKKFGHQILVDGHIVQGLIGPGSNQVTTKEGILRTHGTPRLG